MDWSPLWISLSTAVPATILTFFLGIFAARKITKVAGWFGKLLDILLTLPRVLPPTVAGFLLLLLLGKNGIPGKYLWELGIQIVFTRTAAIIAAVVISFPLMYRSAKGAFAQVDPSLIYAGRTLGMTECRIFWRIILPNAMPGVASGTILALARALGEFGATLMIAGNIPGRTQTMPLAIYMAMQGGRQQEAMVWVLLLIALSFVMLLLMGYFARGYRRSRRKENEPES